MTRADSLPDWLAPALLGAAAEGDGEGVAALLGTLLGTRVRGIVLYGSLATGRWTPASDIDALLLVDPPAPKGLWGRSGSVDLDLHCVLPGADPATFRHVAIGKVLYDADGSAAALLAGTRALPAVDHAPEELARTRTWVARMLRRIRQAEDPALRALYEADLVMGLSEAVFAQRGLPTQGIPGTLRWMRAEAPEIAAALDRWVASRTLEDLERYAAAVLA